MVNGVCYDDRYVVLRMYSEHSMYTFRLWSMHALIDGKPTLFQRKSWSNKPDITPYIPSRVARMISMPKTREMPEKSVENTGIVLIV